MRELHWRDMYGLNEMLVHYNAHGQASSASLAHAILGWLWSVAVVHSDSLTVLPAGNAQAVGCKCISAFGLCIVTSPRAF